MQNSSNLDQGYRTNLGRLAWIRLILIAGEGAAFAAAISLGTVEASPLLFAILLLVQAGVSYWAYWRLRNSKPVTANALFLHLIFDVLTLTALLALTGGSDNPFAMLFLLPLMLTAITLPGRYVWLMLAIALIGYSFLFFVRVPLNSEHQPHADSFRLHVVGMWFGFVLAATLIASFATRMSAALRRQDLQIAQMREHALKQERLLALGTLAASTAHELGTPLTTLAVTLHDIEPNTQIDADALGVLKTQVTRCKDILSSMSHAAGQPRAESGHLVDAREYLTHLVTQWEKTRPDVSHALQIEKTDAPPRIVPDKTLTHAITNVLNNAADASPQHVETYVHWDRDALFIDIKDSGAGLTHDVTQNSKQPGLSTKEGGLGLGLFLSYSTLERLGGSVTLFNRDDSPGAVCRIVLPWNALRAS